MPPYKKCCECPCVGENCLQGYAAGCNHPCCYCEDIQGKTTCDDDYCSTLYACHTNQLTDTGCESITFDVSITYPGALPRRVISGDGELSCGADIVLDKIGQLVQVTNAGLGVPPGVGDPTRTTPCARDECEDCTEPLCANCNQTGGISELSSGLVWPPRDYDTETSYVWPETGGIKTLTAENVGGCMWRGSGYLPTTGERIFLTCDGGSYIECGDSLVESTTICDCPPEACLDSDHPDFEACENSYQCNEWNPVHQGGPLYTYEAGNCWDSPQPPVWLTCCSYNADTGGYNCGGLAEFSPGVPQVKRCDYVIHTVPIRWKATYTLWYDVGNPCEKDGSDGWKQKIEFEPEPVWGSADPAVDPEEVEGDWAPALSGWFLTTPEGKCYSGTCCEVNCDSEDYEPEDCLSFNQLHHSGHEVCTAECDGVRPECSTCHPGGYGDCEPCGYHDPLIKLLGGHQVSDITCPNPLGWSCCGESYSSSSFVWDFYYNGLAPEAFVVDSGAVQYNPPCSVTCPSLDYLKTEWGVTYAGLPWVGFEVEIT